MITQELFERLQKQEIHFHSATIANFVRRLYTPDLNELDECFKIMFPNEKSRLKNGCPKCILADIKKMATEYYAYKDKLKENTLIETEENKLIDNNQITKPKPNGRRKKDNSI